MNDRERLVNLRQDFLKKYEEDWPIIEADLGWEKYERKIPPTSKQWTHARNLVSQLQYEWLDDVLIQRDLANALLSIEVCDDIGKMSNIIDKLQELLEMSKSR